jgi:hypothetical protein
MDKAENRYLPEVLASLRGNQDAEGRIPVGVIWRRFNEISPERLGHPRQMGMMLRAEGLTVSEHRARIGAWANVYFLTWDGRTEALILRGKAEAVRQKLADALNPKNNRNDSGEEAGRGISALKKEIARLEAEAQVEWLKAEIETRDTWVIEGKLRQAANDCGRIDEIVQWLFRFRERRMRMPPKDKRSF